MKAHTMKLGEMLKEAGLIDDFQLKSALSYQRNCGGRLGQALIALKYISEDTLLDFLAEQLKLTRIDLTQRRVPEDVLTYLPEEKARQYNVIPVARKEMHGTMYLLVAMSDPTNLALIDELQFLSGCRVRPALDTEKAIREAVEKYYSALSSDDESSLAEALDQILNEGTGAAASAASSKAAPQPVVKSVTDQKLEKLIRILSDRGLISAEDIKKLK